MFHNTTKKIFSDINSIVMNCLLFRAFLVALLSISILLQPAGGSKPQICAYFVLQIYIKKQSEDDKGIISSRNKGGRLYCADG